MKCQCVSAHKTQKESRDPRTAAPSPMEAAQQRVFFYRVSTVPEPFSSALSNTSFATATSNTDIPMLEQTTI